MARFPSWTDEEASKLSLIEGVEECESHLGVENFSAPFFDKILFFQVIRLKGSFLIWIGDAPKLGDISVALPCPSIRSQVLHSSPQTTFSPPKGGKVLRLQH